MSLQKEAEEEVADLVGVVDPHRQQDPLQATPVTQATLVHIPMRPHTMGTTLMGVTIIITVIITIPQRKTQPILPPHPLTPPPLTNHITTQIES
jgi:hypothetical protein